VGWVVTLSPFYGLHTVLGIFCAYIFRANILVVLALQLVSNPLAEPLILLACYKVGKFVAAAFCSVPEALWGDWDVHSLKSIGKNFGQWIALATFGSILIGYCCTAISWIAYRWIIRRMKLGGEKKYRPRAH
jgi:uncharacterized protein (DUF2062 family)